MKKGVICLVCILILASFVCAEVPPPPPPPPVIGEPAAPTAPPPNLTKPTPTVKPEVKPEVNVSVELKTVQDKLVLLEKSLKEVQDKLDKIDAKLKQRIEIPKAPSYTFPFVLLFVLDGILIIFVIILFITLKKQKAKKSLEPIKSYLKTYLAKGYPFDSLKGQLMQRGFSTEQINQAYSEMQYGT